MLGQDIAFERLVGDLGIEIARLVEAAVAFGVEDLAIERDVGGRKDRHRHAGGGAAVDRERKFRLRGSARDGEGQGCNGSRRKTHS
ncbi:MAG: hypothetical protein WDM81_17480 [Rhizomicrobium sp.]